MQSPKPMFGDMHEHIIHHDIDFLFVSMTFHSFAKLFIENLMFLFLSHLQQHNILRSIL